MVLQNYVILQSGVPARLHFTDHAIEKRVITDRATGKPTTRNVLVFEVDRLNGKEVTAKFSTMAEKLAGKFEAYLRNKSYRDYEFVITQTGTEFLTQYSVQTIPLK